MARWISPTSAWPITSAAVRPNGSRLLQSAHLAQSSVRSARELAASTWTSTNSASSMSSGTRASFSAPATPIAASSASSKTTLPCRRKPTSAAWLSSTSSRTPARLRISLRTRSRSTYNSADGDPDTMATLPNPAADSGALTDSNGTPAFDSRWATTVHVHPTPVTLCQRPRPGRSVPGRHSRRLR